MVRGWLPVDLNASAVVCGFLRRRRGFTDPELWLRLFLLHVGGNLSLAQTVLRAKELGWIQLSAMTLLRRLRQAEGWLQELCAHLLDEQQRLWGQDSWPSAYRVRLIDATDIQEPGSLGTPWRLHYSLRLPEMGCDHYELTDTHQGEKLVRFPFHKGELIIANGAYCHLAGAAHVRDSHADLLLRLHPRLFPLQSVKGQIFDVLEQVRRLPKHSAGEWQVRFAYQRRIYPLRLCAIRLNAVAAARARQRAQRKAQGRGEPLSARSLELAGYVLVVTSLPPRFTASQVLQLYRARWQVELAFKRLKSLLGAGYVPKTTDPSARAWMQAKVLEALLLERLLWEAGLVRWQGSDCASHSQWRLEQEGRDVLLGVLAPALELSTFLSRGLQLRPAFEVRRPGRPMQLQKASQIMIR